MKKVLVTGASGFLGAALTEALARRGDQVVATDVVIGEKLRRIAREHPRVRVTAADLTEWPGLADVFAAERPEQVLHCAAVVGVIASVACPLQTMRVNVEGTINVLECMRLFGARRLVQISSEEVYGHFGAPRIDEEHPRNPIQAYGISKAACEQLGRSYAERHGIEAIAVRTSWVYGPGLPRERVPKNLLTAAATGTRCHIASGADFAVDHTYVDDFVAGTLAALDLPRHRFDTYHVASGEAPTVRQIVEALRELVPGADLDVGPGPYLHGPGVPAATKGALDISRAGAELGYRPGYDLRSGLARSLEAMRR